VQSTQQKLYSFQGNKFLEPPEKNAKIIIKEGKIPHELAKTLAAFMLMRLIILNLRKRFQYFKNPLVGYSYKNTLDLSFQIYFYLLRPKHIFLDQGFKLNL